MIELFLNFSKEDHSFNTNRVWYHYFNQELFISISENEILFQPEIDSIIPLKDKTCIRQVYD